MSFVTDIIDLQLNTNVYQGSKKPKEVIYNDGSNTNDNEFCSVIFAKLLLSFKDFNTLMKMKNKLIIKTKMRLEK